jgi:Domain of unknown function (DUF4145)
MRCPYCDVALHWSPQTAGLGWSSEPAPVQSWFVHGQACGECGEFILMVEARQDNIGEPDLLKLAWPHVKRRVAPKPPEVPDHIWEDYREAAQVIDDSPKASAALSRRCLQAVIREAGGITRRDLFQEIEEAVKTLPTYLADSLHAVRAIGNFAAHPLKSEQTGQVLDVEPGEAEWNLQVLDDLFDFYYVRPARAKARKSALNAKLAEAGKAPLP